MNKTLHIPRLKKRNIPDEALNLFRQYLTSYYRGYRNRKLLDNVETYCMFIGYPRSGHSLMGSLLGAHPDIVIAHELGALKYVFAGFSRRQIYQLILENSAVFAESGSVSGKRYSYNVPGQWQGKFRKLQIIGDKHGEGVTRRLMARPWLLGRLQKIMNGNIKTFHVVRNPYDNISTISKRLNMSLRESIEFYFSLCKAVADVRKQLDHRELFEIRHESFIDDPKESLAQMSAFLGADAPDNYLDDCAGIVFKSPSKTRHTAPWDRELTDIVKKKISLFPFLEGYSYTD